MGKLHLKNPQGVEWHSHGPDCVLAITLNHDVGEFSDGYHTFNELYEHRFLLFLAMVKSRAGVPAYMSKVNYDGSSWDGWFVLWTLTPVGQISYHLPMKYWDIAAQWATEKPRCDDYDGHTSQDVIDRMRLWL